MPWKSPSILKEMFGRWYMVSKWKPCGFIKDGDTYDKGKSVWVLAECKEFEENKDGTWWALFKDLEGNIHSYNQKTIEKIMEYLESIPDEKLRHYLDLFNLYG